MRRLPYTLGPALALCLPTAAHACLTCGNHGDTIRTLFVYGGFIFLPFALVTGVGYYIRSQVRELQADQPNP